MMTLAYFEVHLAALSSTRPSRCMPGWQCPHGLVEVAAPVERTPDELHGVLVPEDAAAGVCDAGKGGSRADADEGGKRLTPGEVRCHWG